MSHVQNAILVYDLTDGEDFGAGLVDAINDHIGTRAGFRHIPDSVIGGAKVVECNVAMVAFNYADEDGVIADLRTFPWEANGVGWVQLMWMGQHDDGFGLIDIYRDRHGLAPAWSPGG